MNKDIKKFTQERNFLESKKDFSWIYKEKSWIYFEPDIPVDLRKV